MAQNLPPLLVTVAPASFSTEPRTSPASSSLPLSFFSSGFVQMAPETTKSKLDRRDFKRPIRRRSPLDGSDSEISCSPPHDLCSERWRSSLETPITGDTKADVVEARIGVVRRWVARKEWRQW